MINELESNQGKKLGGGFPEIQVKQDDIKR